MGAIGRNLILRNYPGICVNVLRITAKKKKKDSREIRCFGPDSKPASPEYKTETSPWTKLFGFLRDFSPSPSLSLCLSVCLYILEMLMKSHVFEDITAYRRLSWTARWRHLGLNEESLVSLIPQMFVCWSYFYYGWRKLQVMTLVCSAVE